MEAPKIDKNSDKWCGYFKNETEARKHFDHELKHLSIDKLIVSAKMELCNAKVANLILYKFSVITANKDIRND
jgi:hypothetical protein